jgi:4-aminobutyrate aminotransferase
VVERQSRPRRLDLGARTLSVDGLVARDAAVISDAAKIRFFPFAPVRGHGAVVTDADGREWIDFTSAWAVANTGYGDEAIRAAVAEQLERGGYPGLVSAVVEPAVVLAERLLQIVPTPTPAKVWFGHSGSDANEAMARLVRRATGRSRIVSFVGSYHGSTDGSASLSGHTAQARYAPAGSVKVPYPDAYRPLFADDAAENERAIVRYLEEYLLASISPADETAATLVEGIQSDGGIVCPSPEFVRGLAETCARHGILLVLDEVKVGLGRTGDWWSFEAAGVTPDLVVLGKALGGGLPLSAIVGRADVLDAEPSMALFTTAGNAFSCAAGLAVVNAIEERDLRGSARRGGELLDGLLHEVAERQPLVGDVRGRGLVRGVELVRDPATREPGARETAKVCFRAAELGLAVFYVGLRSNVLELTPPLCITDAQIRCAVAILDEAIADVAAGRVSDSAVANYAGW